MIEYWYESCRIKDEQSISWPGWKCRHCKFEMLQTIGDPPTACPKCFIHFDETAPLPVGLKTSVLPEEET